MLNGAFGTLSVSTLTVSFSCESLCVTRCPLSLPDIRVSNLLSNVTLQVNVTVVSAVPTDLQLALLTKDDQLPTCVSGQARDDVAIVPVFRGVAVLFEASVATGTNLTFEWTFSDDAAGSQSDEKAWCERRNCSTSTMVGDISTSTMVGDSSTSTMVGDISTSTMVGDSSTSTMVGDISTSTMVGDSSTSTMVGDSSTSTMVGDSSTSTMVGLSSSSTMVDHSSSNTMVGELQ